jgi:hypothetical protein
VTPSDPPTATPTPAPDPIAAINNAKAGATVVVGPGTFTGNVLVPEGVTITGAGIDASWLKGRVLFSSNDTISDLKIGDGGACALRNSVPGASYAAFTRCQFRGGGGAMNSGNDNVVSLVGAPSHLTFQDCNIERNLGTEDAGHSRHFDNVFINPNVVAPSVDTILFHGCHFGVSNGVANGCPRMIGGTSTSRTAPSKQPLTPISTTPVRRFPATTSHPTTATATSLAAPSRVTALAASSGPMTSPARAALAT